MTTEEIALKLQETTDRSVRNEGRIKKLEGEHDVLQSLATSVAVMAEQIKTMNGNVQTLNSKVDKLEEKPGKRWESIVDKVLWAVLAAVIAFLLGRIGL
jgi:predicted nuclease with TOPRIM domain